MAYVSLSDIRDEGIESSELSDDRAEFLRDGWEDFIEKKTGNWFESRELTLLLDGDGSSVLFLMFPIISIEELYINDNFDTPISSDNYVVYNRDYPNDRGNPKIKLKKTTSSSLFDRSSSGSIFQVGDQNQKVIGNFGYVEPDGSVPFNIIRAILVLITLSAELMADGDVDVLRRGLITEELTDRHRIRFANLYKDLGKWSPTGIAEVDQAIMMYSRPMKIRSPRRR